MRSSEKLAIVANFMRARGRWKDLRGPTLERYQEQRAQEIIAYTWQHSPFYRAHWEGHNLQEWRTLPTVEKRLMMESFDTFNTCGIKREQAMEIALRAERERDFSPALEGLTVGLSSGTSGHRGLFLVSSAEQIAWAGTILARTLHQIPLRPLRVAFFLRSNSNLYEQVGGGFINFRYFDLMLPQTEAIVALNSFQPHIIVGPPSLLGALARERTAGRLSARPQRLISVAEVLEAQDKAAIEDAFQISVHQIYQCTEGLLAVSCERGALHIQEDAVVLQFEPLPGDNGERLMPVITDLWRKTQPIIRYRLNDILQLEPEPCACGSSFRVIRAIEGRCDDVCAFEALDGTLRPFYPDTLRRMILLASAEITDYQIAQQRPGQLSIALSITERASFSEVSAAVLESVQQTVAQYACRPATVQIEPDIAPRAPGAKRRRVQVIHAET